LLHEIEPAYDSTTTYLRQRSFSENLRGGLISVSPCFHDYIVQCERVFVAVFESSGHEPKIGSKVVAHLSEIPSPVSCESFPKTKFLRFFTRIRIYYTFKFRNRQLKQKPAAKKRNKKLTKLQHQWLFYTWLQKCRPIVHCVDAWYVCGRFWCCTVYSVTFFVCSCARRRYVWCV